MNNKIKLLTVAPLLVLASCGGGGSSTAEVEKISFWAPADQYTASYYQELTTNYNNGQGKKDGVSVKMSAKSDLSANSYSICMAAKGSADVLACNDRYIFNNINQGLYTPLGQYMDNDSLTTKRADGSKYFDISNYEATNVDRFRFNRQTQFGGAGEELYALPMMQNPAVVYFNKTFFERVGINCISIPESELDAYNAEHGTSYAPRGYAEYAPSAAPAAGLTESKNLNGETVVKVFNNLVSMSYMELNTLSKFFTRSYNAESPSRYGFLTEWWFSHGWSVGGDCLRYDYEMEQNKFVLGDKQANWLVTSDVTVNGNEYKAGDILNYNDRKAYNANPSIADASKLHQLPSQYEQFREFCALSQEVGKSVDSSVTGYAISPSPKTLGNTSKATYFTSGEVAMVALEYKDINDIAAAMSKVKFDMAVTYSYREFENETVDYSQNIKVIGKNYDGVVFEGNIKKENGTPIVGKMAQHSVNLGWTIPQNSAHKEAAWKFIQYLSGKEAQLTLAKSSCGAPTHIEASLSDEYKNISTKKVDSVLVASLAGNLAEIGDWAYVEDNKWVEQWSVELNSDVRNGVTGLDAFFEHQQTAVDKILKENYKFRLHGKE